MKRLPDLATQHVASGYASDDDCKAKPLAKGYGALPGDEPKRKKLSALEGIEYGVRQASSGPKQTRARFGDALKYTGSKLAPSQKKPRTPFEKHCALLSCLPRPKTKVKTDLDYLKENHRFLRSDADDDGSWEARLAKKYYDRLFKEYVICDLSGYKKGQVGFRWRTEAEVVQGKGQFRCGQKRCESKQNLGSYEVDFKYVEAGHSRRALVKVRLCINCAYKLHYKRVKAARKRQLKEERAARRVARKKRKRGEDDGMAPVVDCEADAADCEEDVAADERASSSGADDAAELDGGADTADPEPSEADKELLAAMAWSGPDPAARTREDEIDDFFRDLLM